MEQALIALISILGVLVSGLIWLLKAFMSFLKEALKEMKTNTHTLHELRTEQQRTNRTLDELLAATKEKAHG